MEPAGAPDLSNRNGGTDCSGAGTDVPAPIWEVDFSMPATYSMIVPGMNSKVERQGGATKSEGWGCNAERALKKGYCLLPMFADGGGAIWQMAEK
jgi:hypothetical protein